MSTIKVKAEEIVILPPEVEEVIVKEIETSLQKQNITETVLSRLETEYGHLKINGPDDKEGYLTVQSARKDCKGVRVLISKICKAGRAKANAEADMWIKKEKSLTGRVSKVEDPLEEDEKAYEVQKERQKAEKAAQVEQRAARRIADLVRMGASLDRLNWVLGGVSYENSLIREVDDDIYEGMLAEYQAEYDENQKEVLAREEKKREEEAELRRQQEKVEKDRKELELQQAEFHRQQQAEQDRKYKEVKEKAAAKMKARVEELYALGLTFDFVDHYKGYGCFVPVLDIQCHSDEQWEKLIAEITPVIERKKKEAERVAEEKRQQELEDARLEGIGKSRRAMFKAINCDYPGPDKEAGEATEGEWELYYSQAKAIFDADQKKKVEQQEKERQELLGEKQRYEELVSQLKNITIPAFRSGQYHNKVAIIRDFIDGLK